MEVARGRGCEGIEIVDAARFATIRASASDGPNAVREAPSEYAAGVEWYTDDLENVLEAVGEFLREQETLPLYLGG